MKKHQVAKSNETITPEHVKVFPNSYNFDWLFQMLFLMSKPSPQRFSLHSFPIPNFYLMRNFYLLLAFCTTTLFAQTKMSSHSKQQWQMLYKGIQEQPISTVDWQKKFPQLPIYEVNGVTCVSLMAQVAPTFNASEQHPFFVTSHVGTVAAIKFPLHLMPAVFQHPDIEILEIARRLSADLSRATKDLRADSVWAGFNLPQGFTGAGVIIGVSDWGFDYGHPIFYDTTLTYNRIHAAWDQFRFIGNAPGPFNYGAEFTSANALSAAMADTASPYYDFATHGTHVAGIAGGSGAGTPHVGVAPGAELLFVSQQLDEGAAMDGFHWMQQKATAANKRLVINLSWGLYNMGPIDGTSLLSQVIHTMIDQNVVFVTSAGNNGNAQFHIKKDFQNDSVATRVQFYGYNQHPFMWGQALHMWGTPGAPFAAFFEVHHSSNGFQAAIPVYQTQTQSGFHPGTLLIGTDTIFYNLTIDAAHPLNNRPHITLKVKNTNTQLRIVLKVFANTGTVHIYNVVELSSGVGNWGLPLMAFGPNGMAGNSAYSLGEPAATAGVITAASHIADYTTFQGTTILGTRSNFSSIGPTIDERNKPDISAPGSGITSGISSFTTETITPALSVNFNNKTYHFAAFSGTSMSSPAIAGVAALVLEANPNLSAQQVKDILKATARTDARTGVITPPGSLEWGMGKTTANSAVQLALNTVRLQDLPGNAALLVFPNPTNGLLEIEASKPHHQTGAWQLLDAMGRQLKAGTWQQQAQLDLSDLAAGVYLLRLQSNQFGSRVVRVVRI